uniref:LAM_G_DOMAIN domain-containing protein n=1 Tax=Heterorhabditis bacteriophora TaxID=37862 RepID=A0A1I7XFB5_HETBA
MDVFGSIEEGCAARKDYCKKASCAPNAKCLNRWNGYNCKCPHSAHSRRECNSEVSPHSRSISLTEDESYVIYQMEKTFVPFSLTLEFRTSRTDTQIIVAEFDQRSIFYKLEIEDGLLRFSIGQNFLILNAPEFIPGHWTKIEIDFSEEEVETIIDDLYRGNLNELFKNIFQSIKISLVDISLDVVYAGLAPSTGHPSHFEGCLRDIAINGEIKTVKEKGKVRQGCIVANRCNIEGVCPKQSTCHREWNRHSCKCHKGSYNVQIILQYIYIYIYIMKLGKIYHIKFYFISRGRCTPCECGYGSSNLECSTSGQCKCVGEASGRRCDRCAEEDKILDAKSLKCRSVQERCPSQIEYGVQWPTTFKDHEENNVNVVGVVFKCALLGGVARQSCPGIEAGLATRVCGSDAKWKEVNTWNCTRPEYSIMVSKFDALNSFELMSMLYNATQSSEVIQGRNFEIAESAIHRLIDGELSVRNTDRSHLKDDWFTESLVLSAGRILSSQAPSKYLNLARKLAEYGKAVYNEHERLSFLPPFQLFLVDRLDFSGVLPKFNNFIDRRPLNFPPVTIHIAGGKQVFYSILSNPRCIRCESPVVIVLADTALPIKVEFELNENNGWMYPECVKLHGTVHPTWSTRHSSLIGLNFTHAVCEYNGEGLFTMFTKADNGIYLRLSNSDAVASPVMAGISLLLCALSFVCTIFRKGIKTQLIRLGFIFFFVLNATNIYLIDKISISEVFCPVRNAVFSFTTSSPFAWLFLYSLHLYRMLADGNPKSSATICLLLGLVLPCLLSCATFLFTTQCTTSPTGWLFWFLLIPVALFLL